MQSTTHKSVDFLEKDRAWRLLDASSDSLGRVATQAAVLLMGKHKPYRSPHLDCGDFVVVTNTAQIQLTGNKLKQKTYFKHSGYPDGGKLVSVEKLLKEKPERVMELAVKRMLPKNKLGDKMLKRLKIYSGKEHPHGSQNPKPWK